MKFGDCNEYMEEIQSIGGRLEPPYGRGSARQHALRDVPRVLRHPLDSGVQPEECEKVAKSVFEQVQK